jgi:anti-sigma B factor antagonist
MSIHRREIDGIVVLDVSGQFFGGPETEALERAIANEIASGNPLLLVNLSECRAMNSTAFGVLLAAHRTCQAIGGVIMLCGAERRMKSLLNVLHVNQMFATYPSEAEALAAFAHRATA